jgi:hypothetical protein
MLETESTASCSKSSTRQNPYLKGNAGRDFFLIAGVWLRITLLWDGKYVSYLLREGGRRGRGQGKVKPIRPLLEWYGLARSQKTNRAYWGYKIWVACVESVESKSPIGGPT